jgi:hypothetical protein
MGPRRGSFAKGGGELALERLEVRGTGLGTDGGGSLSHRTGDKSRVHGSGGSIVRVTVSSIEEGRNDSAGFVTGGSSSSEEEGAGLGILATRGIDFLGGTGIPSAPVEGDGLAVSVLVLERVLFF